MSACHPGSACISLAGRKNFGVFAYWRKGLLITPEKCKVPATAATFLPFSFLSPANSRLQTDCLPSFTSDESHEREEEENRSPL